MKRSTLTLSILTALLVSACGGSSSNDEQTKDPTPPKVTPITPTNPSTPSTGKTPTTGNKDNAGSSVGSSASSSSSDPTPPISSGSAPSGGKPIVVNPPKTDEHTDDGDEDEEKKKKDKDDKDTPQDLAQLAKEVGQLTAQVDAQKAEVTQLGETRKTKFTAQESAIKDLLEKLGIQKANQNGAGLTTARVLLDLGNKGQCTGNTAATCEKEYQAAKIAQEKLFTAKEDESKAQETLEKLTTEKNKKAKKLALEEAKAGLKTAEIPVETEYYKAQETLANAEFDNAEAELKHDKLTAEKDRLDRDAGFIEKVQIADLTAAIAAAPTEKQAALTAQKTALEAKVKDLKNKSADIQTKLNTLSGDKKNTAAAVEEANKKITELKKSFGNRGVAGVTGYGPENLLEVIKAEKEDNKPWVITFKGADKPVKIDTTAMTQNLKFSTGNDVIAHFGKLGEDNAAFAEGKTSGKSIYGYVGNKFYSVGTVAPAPEVEKITDLSPIEYNGHALLKAKQQDMVAKFVGYANFGKKSFTGNFSNFENYSPVTASGQNETKATTLAAGSPLTGKTIWFDSTIEGNKFKTVEKNDEKANVYGYFYNFDETTTKKPLEVGGLVEYKEMFHGSFGGAKK